MLFLLAPAWALDPERATTQYVHDSWQTEQGLPQNSIHSILQTRDGYLWLGTEEGLVRFDGIRFTVFDKRNTPTLKNNYIWTLFEDEKGTLWIGTYGGGLVRYEQGKFSAFTDFSSTDVIRAIYIEQNGNIWLGTDSGLICKREVRLDHYSTANGLIHNRINCLFKDSKGNLWIGSDGGLSRWDGNSFASVLRNQRVITILEVENNIYAGTVRSGLIQCKMNSECAAESFSGTANLRINSITRDRNRNLWLGTTSGAVRMNGTSISRFTSEHGLSNDGVLCTYEDREGNVWIGTAGGGLNRLKEGKLIPFGKIEGLPDDMVSAILEDKSGQLWIGTYGTGLARYKDGQFTWYSKKEGLSSNVITALHETREGEFWIGTANGLNRLTGGKIVRRYSKKDGLTNDSIRSILQDREGRLWIGTYGGGVNELKANGTFRAITAQEGLTHNFVTSLMEDRDGALWIGTDGGGITCLTGDTMTMFTTKNGLSNNIVFELHIDSQGYVWIGTGGGGLNVYRDGKLDSFTTTDGLYDDVVYRILEARDGNFWISCNKGIYLISRTDLLDFADHKRSRIRFKSYGRSDGMRSAECNGGVQPAGWRRETGDMWFPTIRGAVKLSPHLLTRNLVKPPVTLEEVRINKHPIALDSDPELPAAKGELEFRYTAPSFYDPAKVQFRYILEGFDENWVEAEARRTAFYTNIPAGKYRFRIIACNNDGLWNDAGASISFTLTPYFYQRRSFFLFCMMGILTLAGLLYKARVHNLHRRQSELVRLVEERTGDLMRATRRLEDANKQRADFVSGVSHELKTPLTLIRLYGETLLYHDDDLSAEQRRKHYETITRESERLTKLIEKVLDFSRIDRGKKEYRLVKGDMADLVKRMADLYSQYLLGQGFNVETEVPESVSPVLFDATAVEEVLLNLLDNAAKYSRESKHIALRLSSQDKHVVLEVEDHGPGIEAEEQGKIFEQFYRGSHSDGKGGYGLGLFLVKHVMDAHKGTIEVISGPEQGTCFRLIFPIVE